MRRRLGLLALSALALAAIWFERTRRRGDLPHLVTHRFNPLVMSMGLAGGRVSPWAVLEHVGRTTGTVYHTPISVIASRGSDDVYIRLSYGSDVQWVKNVLAAGRCRLQQHGTLFDLDEPAVIPASENPLVPPRVRRALDRAGRSYLRLRVVSRTPGTLDLPPA